MILLTLIIALYAPVGSPPVTLYREVVCATPFDLAPLASRFPALDRPTPFTRYTAERD